jgi:hypothetical protein
MMVMVMVMVVVIVAPPPVTTVVAVMMVMSHWTVAVLCFDQAGAVGFGLIVHQRQSLHSVRNRVEKFGV